MIPHDPIHWPRLAPAIARALLGQPTRATRRELRYGRKGSLRIDLETGTFADFESGRSGGMPALIQHVKGGDGQTAWRWLQDHGLVAGRALRVGREQVAAPQPGRGRPAARTPDREGEAQWAAGRLWQGAVRTDTGPLRAYLTRRRCWRPGDAIPAWVRWVDPAVVSRGRWDPSLPPGAAGGMIVAFTNESGTVTAVQIEALMADGRRTTPRWRKARGRMAGTAFRVAGANGPLRLCEGPIDALALAAAYRGPVWAAGGSGNLARLAGGVTAMGQDVVVHADGDGAGARAAAALASRVRSGGTVCTIVRQDGMDPADWVAERVAEQAAILECDGGLGQEEAERRAWETIAWI